MVFPQGEVGRIQGEWKDGFLEGKGRVEQTAGGWQEAVFRLTLHFVLFGTLSAGLAVLTDLPGLLALQATPTATSGNIPCWFWAKF